MSSKEKAIKDLIYLSDHTNIENFFKRSVVLNKAKELGLVNLKNYVGINSKKYLDLLVENWETYR